VQTSGTEAAGINRLIASRNRRRVQIETTPVMRGTVHPVRTITLRPGVERAFGFAEMQVLDFADLYAGKLSAALSRQHPRDLFDMQPLLADGRLDIRLWRTFLVYLTCSPKPAAEILAPKEPRDFQQTFTAHFQGMTAEPVTAEGAAGCARPATEAHLRIARCDIARVPRIRRTRSARLSPVNSSTQFEYETNSGKLLIRHSFHKMEYSIPFSGILDYTASAIRRMAGDRGNSRLEDAGRGEASAPESEHLEGRSCGFQYQSQRF
jgi:hypothetical protein